MSKLSEMLATLCPNGVEYKRIGSFAECFSGATPKTGVKQYWDNGTIPWMSSGEVNQQIVTRVEKRITKEGYDSCSTRMVPVNSVVIALAGQGKTRGLVALTRVDLCTNQSLCAIVPNASVLSDYLYYYLQSRYQDLRAVSSGDGTRGGLNLKMVRDYLIPVPPLPIQREIVQTLDNFANLTAELTAELAKRKKQYEHYRDMLLNFRGGGVNDSYRIESEKCKVEWKRLGEVLEVITPSLKIKRLDYLATGQIPIVSQEIDFISGYCNQSDKKLLAGEYVCFGDHSEHIKYIDFAFVQGADGLKILTAKDNLAVTKYLYYAAQNFYQRHNNYERHFKYFEETMIPLPPLAEQKRIVAILDRFDSLCNSLTEGLPAEIALRKKQYEYYRDKLLSFKEAG